MIDQDVADKLLTTLYDNRARIAMREPEVERPAHTSRFFPVRPEGDEPHHPPQRHDYCGYDYANPHLTVDEPCGVCLPNYRAWVGMRGARALRAVQDYVPERAPRRPGSARPSRPADAHSPRTLPVRPVDMDIEIQ